MSKTEYERIMSVEEIRDRLRFFNMQAVSEAVGLSRQALYDIRCDKHDPKYSTVLTLSNFLDNK
jgi:DNA-binding phage protein